MIVTASNIEQLEKHKKRKYCRKWRICVSTDCGRKTRRVNGTYRDALAAQEAFIQELSDIIPDTDTFAAYAHSWLDYRAKSGDYAPGTIANDRRNVNALCRSALAGMAVSTITPELCRDALVEIKLNPQKNDREMLSGTTMNKIYITLRQILSQAENDGKIVRNPLANIAAPRVDTKEKQALTPAELMELLDALDTLTLDGRVMAMYLIVCLGLRRAEACALQNVDVMNGCAFIRAAVKERNGTIGAPKSDASVRVLPIPDRLQATVNAWRYRRFELGLEQADTLACNTHGGILRPQLLYRWWTGDATHSSMAEQLGYRGVTLHQLRHSNLSMVARYMSPYDLQRYAGWSSIEPARVYIHENRELLSAALYDCWCNNGANGRATGRE